MAAMLMLAAGTVTLNAQNLINNPGFEEPIGTEWYLKSATVKEIVTDEGHESSSSLLLQGTASYDVNNYDFTDYFNKTATLSFWYKTTEGETTLQLLIRGYTANFSKSLSIGEPDTGVNNTLPASDTEWKQVSFTFEPVNETRSLADFSILSLELGQVSKPVFFDDMVLEVKGGTGIFSPRADVSLPVYTDGGVLYVSPREAGTVTVYNLQGQQVAAAQADTAGGTIAVRDLPRGQVYIVRSGTQSGKVVL